MKFNNDPTSDELADRLRREAMAERPPFSPDLHARILRQVRAERPAGNSMRLFPMAGHFAAAAMILLACGLAARWQYRSHSAAPAHQNAPIAVITTEAPPADSSALTLNVGGIFSTPFEPRKLDVRLPVAGADISLISVDVTTDEPAAIPARPGLPEWLLSVIAQPASSANVALADVVPADFRDLFGTGK
jgi:hypothetical protein